jgi:hypothetical protein
MAGSGVSITVGSTMFKVAVWSSRGNREGANIEMGFAIEPIPARKLAE